jgi:hypothetical protein
MQMFWTYVGIAVVVAFGMGFAARDPKVLALPAVLSAGALALAVALFASGFPSYDNDPMLGVYALVSPVFIAVVLGAPMALGVFVGRRGQRDDR